VTILIYAPLLLKAAAITLWISWLALLLGGIVGGLVGMARTSEWRTVRALALIYTETFRSIPIIVLMFFCYFGLPLMLNIDLPAFAAAVVALGLEASALMSEVVRGGIESVASGQRDAGRSLGLRNSQIMRLIVGPQASRVALPPTIGVYIAVLKDSSIASIIGYVELTKSGLLIRDATGHGFEVLAGVFVLYFVMNYTISLVGRALERKYRIVAY
jgi:His/Glu/Gln/Arg/opine family amino acid ABC transporter permease subunit